MAEHPSLRALEAVEAAARTGGFVSAADELSVSPAAVSQLVRNLEDQLGRKLFHRINRRTVPTEAALEILPRLTTAFEELKSVSRQLAGAAPRARLTVSVPPSLATGWLSARLSVFVARHGTADISIRGEDDPVPFERDRIDLRLSYGRFHYRDHDTREIANDCVLPVCAPAMLRDHGPFDTAESIMSAPLIHTDWGPKAAAFPTWRDWFELAGVSTKGRIDRGITADSSKSALDLAVSGLGVALVQGYLAGPALRQGHLARVSNVVLKLGQPYCVTIPHRSRHRSLVPEFSDWLERDLNADIGFAHGE